MPEALFWLFSLTAIIAGVFVVISRQVIKSALWMFAAILSLSGMMACLGAYLLALLTMLVYAGAVLVLFLFVIMFMGGRAHYKQVGKWRMMWAILALIGGVLFCLPIFAGVAQMGFGVQRNTLSLSGQYGIDLFGRYQLATMFVGWTILWVTVALFNIVDNKHTQQRATV